MVEVEDTASAESWPPIAEHPVRMRQYGGITLSEEGVRIVLTQSHRMRGHLALMAWIYAVGVASVPLAMIVRATHTLSPAVLLPILAQAAGFRMFLGLCGIVLVLGTGVIYWASRLMGARSRTEIAAADGVYRNAYRRTFRLSEVGSLRIDPAVVGYTVRFWPKSGPAPVRWLRGTFVFPVWGFGPKETAVELGERLSELTGLPLAIRDR